MYFNVEKIRRRVEELAKLRFPETRPLAKVYAQPSDQPEKAVELHVGDRWGERDKIYLINFRLDIPVEWRGQPLALCPQVSALGTGWYINTVEGLIFINGKPFHALDRYHREIVLTSDITENASLDITIRLWTGINEDFHTVERLELRRIDEASYQITARWRCYWTQW